MVEPLTSLLRRELVILAKKYGDISSAHWELARVLREHLQPELKNAKMAPNKGQLGAEISEPSGGAPLLPGLVEPEILSREYD